MLNLKVARLPRHYSILLFRIKLPLNLFQTSLCMSDLVKSENKLKRFLIFDTVAFGFTIKLFA